MRKNLIVLEDLVKGFGPVVQERVGKMRSCTSIGVVPGISSVDDITPDFEAFNLVNYDKNPSEHPSGMYVRSSINPGLEYPDVVEVDGHIYVNTSAMILQLSQRETRLTPFVVLDENNLTAEAKYNTLYHMPLNTVGKLVLNISTLASGQTCSVINNAEGSFFDSVSLQVLGMKFSESFGPGEIEIPQGVSVVHRQGDIIFVSSL